MCLFKYKFLESIYFVCTKNRIRNTGKIRPIGIYKHSRNVWIFQTFGSQKHNIKFYCSSWFIFSVFRCNVFILLGRKPTNIIIKEVLHSSQTRQPGASNHSPHGNHAEMDSQTQPGKGQRQLQAPLLRREKLGRKLGESKEGTQSRVNFL